jgi:Mu-like prophage FluMu protein gp28
VTDAQLAASVVEKWARDPWAFIRDACLTRDEADAGAVKRFPDLPYLAHVCRVWQRYPMLAVPKSRRMMLTWIMLALHLHLALFTPNSAVFIQSKKAEDSDYLIDKDRMLFIYSNLPHWLRAYGLPTVQRKQYNLTFSNGSMIRAIAQGEDQLRQYTATAVLCDEIAFWDRAAETWRALRPVVQGGGKVTLVSSAAPGFFERVVNGGLRGDH